MVAFWGEWSWWCFGEGGLWGLDVAEERVLVEGLFDWVPMVVSVTMLGRRSLYFDLAVFGWDL